MGHASFSPEPGASTFWLAKRAASVRSVEHDGPWLEKLGSLMGENANIHLEHQPLIARPSLKAEAEEDSEIAQTDEMAAASYLSSIETGGPNDLIVIDGRNRAQRLVQPNDRSSETKTMLCVGLRVRTLSIEFKRQARSVTRRQTPFTATLA